MSSVTYNTISTYTYNKISTYTYNKISTYTYNKISGYTYDIIIGYAYYQISTYQYTYISGYTTNYVISGYTYNRKTGYTYAGTTTITNQVVKTYDYILHDGDYKLANLTGSVFVQGRARLYVTDDINITGQDSITLGSGGGLKLYASAPTVSIAGQGVVNDGGNAMDFAYFGLPSNTKLNFTGNSSFTGTIYAPSAAFKLGGGGIDTFDFIGASVTKTVDMNGHYNFHYDENLGRVALARGYVIKSWVEISLSQVK